ncbi:MAG: DUF1045 domain-containing protein [Pseudomonadota bacterium]
MFRRYAIFYTPPPGPFADFCASWLGWDSRAGEAVAHPAISSVDVATITAVPQKYGFHGTLKAPFRLAGGQDMDDLTAAAAAFASATPAITVESMALQHERGFLALRPVGDTTALDALAARIVTNLDHFRAPAGEAELARRRQAGLSERQDHNLITWGYPYVMEDFHFHLTLSGRIDADTAQTVISQMGPMLRPLVPKPFPIDHITLMGQAEDEMFHEIQRYALAG